MAGRCPCVLIHVACMAPPRHFRGRPGAPGAAHDASDMNPDAQRALVMAEKPELRLLPTVELNAETPAHLLDDDITPVRRLFARNTGDMPVAGTAETAAWTLAIDGCVRAPRSWTVRELQRGFETVTRIAVLECAGNGRAFFTTPAGTVLWQHGA